MYQTISEYQFRDTFLQSDTYKNNFTYDGLSVLFDYLEQVEQDTGQEIPFDYVSIACEFSEASPREIFDAFDLEPMEDDDGHWLAVREYLEDNGSYVGHTDSTIIYINHLHQSLGDDTMKPHHDYVRLWVASIETRNFNFTAYGATKSGAEFALKQGLLAHAEQYGLESDWYHEGDIVAEEVALGHAYRYGSGAPIYTP